MNRNNFSSDVKRNKIVHHKTQRQFICILFFFSFRQLQKKLYPDNLYNSKEKKKKVPDIKKNWKEKKELEKERERKKKKKTHKSSTSLESFIGRVLRHYSNDTLASFLFHSIFPSFIPLYTLFSFSLFLPSFFFF